MFIAVVLLMCFQYIKIYSQYFQNKIAANYRILPVVVAQCLVLIKG